jgi:hypothetical protein
MKDAPLTPAEAYILLHPEGWSPIEAIKITLCLLVAMEVLKVTTIEARVLFLKQVTRPVVSVVRDPPAIFLAAEIVDVVRTARSSEHGHNFLAMAHSANKKKLIAGPMNIVTRLIFPALVARGWLEPREQNKDSLGSRPRTLYRHTPAGLAEKQRIQSLLDRARQLPTLIDTNPAEAKAIMLAAGSLLLLVPELKIIYGKLAALDAGSLQFGGFDASVLDQGFADFESYFDGSRFS